MEGEGGAGEEEEEEEEEGGGGAGGGGGGGKKNKIMQNSREPGERNAKISGCISCRMRSAASPMLSGSRLQIEAPCNTYLDQV